MYSSKGYSVVYSKFLEIGWSCSYKFFFDGELLVGCLNTMVICVAKLFN